MGLLLLLERCGLITLTLPGLAMGKSFSCDRCLRMSLTRMLTARLFYHLPLCFSSSLRRFSPLPLPQEISQLVVRVKTANKNWQVQQLEKNRKKAKLLSPRCALALG